MREVLGSLSIPVSQTETEGKIYSLLREDNDKNIPEYIQVDMDAQTIGNCGYAQTEALLMGGALAGRIDSSGDKLPKVDSRKFQNALTSAKEIYLDLSLANQMRAFEEVLYIRDENFVPSYLSQEAKANINDRRAYLTDPIAKPLFEKIFQRFSNNIDIFQNTIYENNANAILKKANIQIILDSAIGKELQRVNSIEASTKLLEDYVKSSSTALEDLNKIYNKAIKTRVKDGLSRSKLLTEIIKHSNDNDNSAEVLLSLSIALNPNNIVAIDTKDPLKKALFYAAEKGDEAMLDIFKSALGGDAALSAQELNACNELELRSKNIKTTQVTNKLKKTIIAKENTATTSDPVTLSQSTEINYSKEAEKLGVNSHLAKRIKNEYQIKFIQDLKAQNKKVDWSNIEGISQITTEYQVEAEQLGINFATKITNQYQIVAATNLKARNERIWEEGLLQINNQYQAEATKFLHIYDAIKITNQHQIDAATNLKARNEWISGEYLLQINNQYQAEATKYLSIYEAIKINNELSQYQIDTISNLKAKNEWIGGEYLLQINNQYQAEATKWLGLSESLKIIDEDAFRQLKLDVSNGKISKYRDIDDSTLDYDSDDSNGSYNENYLEGIISLGVTQEDAKRVTTSAQIFALSAVIRKGEEPSSSTVDTILQMSDYQVSAARYLPIIDAMKINDFVKLYALINLQENGREYNAADIDAITKVSNQMQAKAATWLPPRFFLSGLEQVEISNYFQVEALEVLSNKGISLDNVSNLVNLDKIENSFQIQALQHLPLIDAVKINDKAKIAALNDYIIKNGKLDNQNIDEILLQTSLKPKDEEVEVTILGEINSYLKKHDPLRILGEAAAEEIPSTHSNNQADSPKAEQTAKTESIDNSWILKKAYYHSDVTKLHEIFAKHNLKGSVDLLRTKHGYRELSRKLHPDKPGGNEEDFRFMENLREKLSKDLDINAVTVGLQTTLSQANMAFKVADTTIDAVRLVNEPTVANAQKVALDTAHLASMHYGFSGYSSIVGATDVLSKISQGQYKEAVTSAATSIAYMVAPTVIQNLGAHLGVPYLDTAYSVAMTAYTGYNTLSNAYSLYKEYGSEESKQRSIQAYDNLNQALAKTPLERIYSFKNPNAQETSKSETLLQSTIARGGITNRKKDVLEESSKKQKSWTDRVKTTDSDLSKTKG